MGFKWSGPNPVAQPRPLLRCRRRLEPSGRDVVVLPSHVLRAQPRTRDTRLAVVALLLALSCAFAAGVLWAKDAEAQELSYDQVYELAAGAIGHGPGAHFATRVARCESSHVASAYSAGWDRLWRVNYSHVGLWQIESNIWGATAWRVFGDSLWEPRVNAGMMGLILREQGWRVGWPYCSRVA